MIELYEIRFKDSDTCTIKICQTDPSGNEVTALDVCLKYKEKWESALESHITSFFSKHPDVLTFEETYDELRSLTSYKITATDQSVLIIDAVEQVKNISYIEKAKAHK